MFSADDARKNVEEYKRKHDPFLMFIDMVCNTIDTESGFGETKYNFKFSLSKDRPEDLSKLMRIMSKLGYNIAASPSSVIDNYDYKSDSSTTEEIVYDVEVSW